MSGGENNTASGKASIVSGGADNIAAGDYSWAGGHNMQLTEDADRTFVWGHSDSNVSISTPDSFIIYSGNVGIGTKNPAAMLEVDGGVYFEGGNGDVSNDGSLELADSLMTASYLHGAISLDREQLANADIDGDGRVTWEDVMMIYDFSRGKSKDSLKREFHSVYGAVSSDTFYVNGNAGIGTQNPTEKLEVAGTVKATAFVGDGSCLTGISSESFARSTSKTVTASYLPEFGDPGLIADGIFAPESTEWSDANYAVGLNTAGYDTNLKIDLGAIYDIYRLRVQADCNDDYKVEYSMDDSTWNALYDLPRAAHPGLRTRDSGTFESVKARYLRIYVVSGDDKYSVSEVEVYAYGINIADSGNVGIGTMNPEKPLVVTGSEERGIVKLSFSNSDRNLSLGGDWPYIDSYGSGARLLLNFNSDQDIDIGNGDLYIVNSSGNVGIGTSEPRNKLDIGNAFSFHDLGDKVIGIGYVPGNDTSLVNGYSAAIRLNPSNGGLQIQTNSRFGTVGNWVGASATRMMIDRNGNIGIGTMTPGAKLDVSGDLIIGGTFNINGQLFKNAGSFSLGNGINKYEWKNNAIDTTLMVLDNTGNLGIGTTNPGAKLTISNSISNDYGKSSVFVNSHNSYFDFYGGLVFRGTGQLWSARFTGTDSMSSDGEILGIYREEIGAGTLGESIAVFKNNGNVGIGTTSPAHRLHVIGDIAYTGSLYDVSDIRIKENVTYIENAVEKVSSINGIYFNNKGESPEKREVGVIAQEVEEVLPEVVSEDNDGYKSVDYSKLTPLLIEAIKELKSENEELKERISALEAALKP